MEVCGINIDFEKQKGYFLNADCMKGMKEFPDKYFDLAIVDPPYGINIGQSSVGAGGELHHTGTDQQRICAPGGGNKQYIPFGGKKNPKYSGGQSRLAEQNPSERIRVEGVSAAFPKFTRRSMTATHRTPSILRNLNEWQRNLLYGVGTTFSII